MQDLRRVEPEEAAFRSVVLIGRRQGKPPGSWGHLLLRERTGPRQLRGTGQLLWKGTFILRRGAPKAHPPEQRDGFGSVAFHGGEAA